MAKSHRDNESRIDQRTGRPMRSRIFLVTFATFLTVSVNDSAQQASRWCLGVGAAVPDSVYAGEGTRVTPLPLVAF
jgi:outer membrane scaffolding protein for murein synthesis (MipA/OmpV family)